MKSLKIIMILASLSETVAVSWSRHCSSSSHHPLSVRHIISGKADSCCDCGWFSLRGGGRRRRDETDNDTYEQKRNRGGNRKQQHQRYFDLQETEEDEQFPASFLDEEDIKEQEKIISALSKKDKEEDLSQTSDSHYYESSASSSSLSVSNWEDSTTQVSPTSREIRKRLERMRRLGSSHNNDDRRRYKNKRYQKNSKAMRRKKNTNTKLKRQTNDTRYRDKYYYPSRQNDHYYGEEVYKAQDNGTMDSKRFQEIRPNKRQYGIDSSREVTVEKNDSTTTPNHHHRRQFHPNDHYYGEQVYNTQDNDTMDSQRFQENQYTRPNKRRYENNSSREVIVTRTDSTTPLHHHHYSSYYRMKQPTARETRTSPHNYHYSSRYRIQPPISSETHSSPLIVNGNTVENSSINNSSPRYQESPARVQESSSTTRYQESSAATRVQPSSTSYHHDTLLQSNISSPSSVTKNQQQQQQPSIENENKKPQQQNTSANQKIYPTTMSMSTPWARKFIKSRPKDALLPIPRDFLSDGFNLVQLASIVEQVVAATFCTTTGTQVDEEKTKNNQKSTSTSASTLHKVALKLILSDTGKLDNDVSSIANNYNYITLVNEEEVIQKAAEVLYSLLHSRYISSPRGLDTIRRMMSKQSQDKKKQQQSTANRNSQEQQLHADNASATSGNNVTNAIFGKCQRVACKGNPLLPYGQSGVYTTTATDGNNNPDRMGMRYCCCCGETFYVWESKVDGSAWGPYFCHLFLMTHGIDLFPWLLQEAASKKRVNFQMDSSSGKPIPKIFGFRIHPEAMIQYPIV